MTDTGGLFEMLSNLHRRRLLLILCQQETVEIPDGLVVRGGTEAQMNQQSDGPVQSETPVSRSLEIELIHSHLPKLEEAGYIEWDRETQTASRGPAFEEIESALRVLNRNERALPTGLW
jgi:hypothetical protein